MCSMGVRASRMSRSQVINNDLHPKWNEDFKLLVHEPEHQVPLSAPIPSSTSSLLPGSMPGCMGQIVQPLIFPQDQGKREKGSLKTSNCVGLRICSPMLGRRKSRGFLACREITWAATSRDERSWQAASLWERLASMHIAPIRHIYTAHRRLLSLHTSSESPEVHVQVLRLVLYDHDTLDKDDEIGEAKLAVKDLKNQEEKDIWLDISECQPDQAASHKVRGSPARPESPGGCAASLPCRGTRPHTVYACHHLGS